MCSAVNVFRVHIAQLKEQLTPSVLGHQFVEDLLLLCFTRAGHSDAVKLTHLLMASVVTDHNELRLDVPPAVQAQFMYARTTYRQLLEWAFDDDIAGPVKPGVVDAVNQLGEKLSSFDDEKEAVRADSNVEKYILVLSLYPTTLRTAAAPPQPQVMWLEAVKGTAEGRTKFISSVRSFAALNGRRKVLAMLQQYILGPYAVVGTELTTDLDDIAAAASARRSRVRTQAQGSWPSEWV